MSPGVACRKGGAALVADRGLACPGAAGAHLGAKDMWLFWISRSELGALLSGDGRPVEKSSNTHRDTFSHGAVIDHKIDTNC